MTSFADDLRQAETDGAIKEEIDRVKAELRQRASKGFIQHPIYEFYHGRRYAIGTLTSSRRSGTVTLSSNRDSGIVILEGPVKKICDELENDGLEISFSTEQRFSDHPSIPGIVTTVIARWL